MVEIETSENTNIPLHPFYQTPSHVPLLTTNITATCSKQELSTPQPVENHKIKMDMSRLEGRECGRVHGRSRHVLRITNFIQLLTLNECPLITKSEEQ
ncbi:hypothetical protein TNCV_2334691 [Trichonephila clavipes]|nr:hypothetical protein TNCV_2334691 [Trichonephila clavipes]